VPGNYQIKLYEDTQEAIRLYQSIDSIKRQFGERGVMRAAGVRRTDNQSIKLLNSSSHPC
jgi:hypothetical protein